MWKLSAKSRSFRASARSTSAAVASAPGSAAGGFSDNWRASAAAIAELAEGLDFIFEQVNYEGLSCIFYPRFLDAILSPNIRSPI